jgi:TPP-dependent 2-oxoacid decarboxylase
MISEKSRLNGRTILFEGDGSLQMSVQAIGDAVDIAFDGVAIVVDHKNCYIQTVANDISNRLHTHLETAVAFE